MTRASCRGGCDSSRSSCCVFFFSSRRRHTRFDCDWSSDVCSSDLEAPTPVGSALDRFLQEAVPENALRQWLGSLPALRGSALRQHVTQRLNREIGRASCRERV